MFLSADCIIITTITLTDLDKEKPNSASKINDILYRLYPVLYRVSRLIYSQKTFYS